MNQQVGRYRVLRQVGRGAMGIVYLAEDPLLGRRVAIKSIDLAGCDAGQESFLRDRLLRDARAAALLSHPHIVPVFDVVDDGESAYLVMEFVDGETLAERLRREPRPDRALAIRLLREIAEALDHTHARGVIHRDVKPANVMIDAAGHARIMDFGIARLSGARTSTPAGVALGTVEYMAPEQITGGSLDGRTDQFSLAAIAYEMLAGGAMFGAQTPASLAYQIVHAMPDPVHRRNPAVPEPVDAVLARGLAKSPESRYACCGDFVSALDDALKVRELATVALPRPVVAADAPVQRPGRRRTVVWTVAAFGALTAAGSAVLVLRPPPQPAPATAPPPAAPARVSARKRDPKPKAKAAVKPQEFPATPDAAPALDAVRFGAELASNGDDAGAIEAYSQALAARPLFPRALMGRGQARQRSRRFDEAIEDFSSVIRIQPENAGAWSARGTCYLRMKQPDRAIADFDRAIELNPELRGALAGKGHALLQQKRYPEAVQAFDEAIRVAPDHGPAFAGRAAARRALGDAAGAERDLQESRDLDR